jgi:hypothetical protein
MRIRTSPRPGTGSSISPTNDTSRAGPCRSYQAAIIWNHAFIEVSHVGALLVRQLAFANITFAAAKYDPRPTALVSNRPKTECGGILFEGSEGPRSPAAAKVSSFAGWRRLARTVRSYGQLRRSRQFEWQRFARLDASERAIRSYDATWRRAGIDPDRRKPRPHCPLARISRDRKP